MQRAILLFVLSLFSMVTFLALLSHGYWGIIEPHFKSWGAGQVFFDLVIALSIFIVWLWGDAKAKGRNFWFWTAMVLASGSIGALLYLLTQKRSAVDGQQSRSRANSEATA